MPDLPRGISERLAPAPYVRARLELCVALSGAHGRGASSGCENYGSPAGVAGGGARGEA